MPKLSYINHGDGTAKVTCVCGWEQKTAPISPFDPGEAMTAASAEHLQCAPGAALDVMRGYSEQELRSYVVPRLMAQLEDARAEIEEAKLAVRVTEEARDLGVARVKELEEEAEDDERLRARLTELLDGVAIALKGPPPELVLHDWSDLPTLALSVVKERDSMREAAQAAVPDAVKALDEYQDLNEKVATATAALQSIVDHVDKDREKFINSFVLLGPRAAMPLYNFAKGALALLKR